MIVKTFVGHDLHRADKAIAAAEGSANKWMQEQNTLDVIQMSANTFFHGGFYHTITLLIAEQDKSEQSATKVPRARSALVQGKTKRRGE